MASTKAGCPRSLFEVLISAASTAVFIAAANFGFAPIISSKAGTWARWFQCLKMALGEPFRAFAHSLIPTELEVTEEGYAGDHPKKKKFQISDPNRDWMQKDVKVVTREYIHPWNPLELPAQPLPAPAGVALDEYVEGVQRSQLNEGHVREVRAQPLPATGADLDDVEGVQRSQSSGPYYIKLHPSQYWRSTGMMAIEQRTWLLKLNLVPEYAQLRYLRARSTFQAVVTTVQSFGYMLGVGQRIVVRSKVSPLEAIMAFFNLLIVLQFIMNLYSCVHYQRPLLLRLSRDQFINWCSRAHSPSSNNQPSSSTTTTSLARAVFLVLISLAFYTIIQFSFIHYALSYLHHCILCSLSAFLVCFLALSALILVALFSIPCFRNIWRGYNKWPQYALRICTCIISTSSTILALVATIISWDKFKDPTGSLLQWIVPYVHE
ncbi:hypothetical protein GOP47_0021706 [Adiantum capillus-veneris]|uniref:Uncharacterized protein n=1 Tax=Adiantum capillus-veneris TaxID=13818 RepID=A0A9D4Z6H3_ADICA|nr:hypothetical protein GOP47_0021706 [Adiantum capillus-veneris]